MLRLLVVLTMFTAGCGRVSSFSPRFPGEEPPSPGLEELARRYIGEFKRHPSGQLTNPDDPLWVKPRLRLSPDGTARFIDFPAEMLTIIPNQNEPWLNCDGKWSAASDESGLVLFIEMATVNGRQLQTKFVFRPGDIAVLYTLTNNSLGMFKRTRSEP